MQDVGYVLHFLKSASEIFLLLLLNLYARFRSFIRSFLVYEQLLHFIYQNIRDFPAELLLILRGFQLFELYILHYFIFTWNLPCQFDILAILLEYATCRVSFNLSRYGQRILEHMFYCNFDQKDILIFRTSF